MFLFGRIHHAHASVLRVQTEKPTQKGQSLLQLNCLPVMQQVHRLLALLLIVPIHREQELDQDLSVLFLTVAISEEERLLLLLELEEVGVLHGFVDFGLLHCVRLELAVGDGDFARQNVELVGDRIVALHELDVVEHDKWVVHATNLQIVVYVLLNGLLLSFISLCPAPYLNVEQLDTLVNSVVCGLLPQLLLI